MISNIKPELKLSAFSNYLLQRVCHEMIAVCAYYKAEKRIFSWLRIKRLGRGRAGN